MFLPDQIEEFVNVDEIKSMRHNYNGEWTDIPEWNVAKLILLAAVAMRVNGVNVLRIEMNDGTVVHIHTTKFNVPQEFLRRMQEGGNHEG